MKKIFWIFSVAAMAISVASCDPKKEEPTNLDDITEDGFYVIGEATGKTEVTGVLAMAKGINEWGSDDLGIKSQQVRDGMFEKYIVLEGGKEFTLAYVNGGQKTAYGANLKAFKPAAIEGDYADNPADGWFVGKLEVGDSAPKMKMEKTGLYHIVLDLNNDKLLTDAQILVSPVTWGVRGGMNSWSFTALEATAPSNDGITYTLSGQELGNNGDFKFAYNGGWKILLGKSADGTKYVKANTNLGTDCKPGGDNIVVTEGAGKYKITLTYKLAAGDLAKSFSYKIEQESKSDFPADVYMIGQDFGAWSWESDGVVTLQKISAGGDAKDGCFVTTRYFKADSGFKFATAKDWGKAFGSMTNKSAEFTFDGDGNAHVPSDGLWTITIDYTTDMMTLTEGMIYGMGPAFNDDWTTGKYAGVINPDGSASITALSAGALRVYAPCAFDWWQHEFQPTADGKIEYREGGELAAFNVAAGDVVTFDFNAGTAVLGAPAEEGAIKIDGDLSDWDDIEEGFNGNHVFKFTMDEKYVYFYSHRAKDESYDALWGSSEGYVYFALDLDKNAETGDQTLWGNGPFEYVGVVWPYAGSAAAPSLYPEPETAATSSASAIPGFKMNGAIDDSGVAIEFRIPRENLPAIPETPFIVYSWGSTGLAKVEYHVGEPQPGAMAIDGDLSDWDAIDTQVASTKDTPVYALFKVTNDKKNIYFYTKRDTRDAIWSRGGYVYYDIDADNNPATGVNKEIDGLEMWLYFFPFDGKEIATDVGSGDAYPSKAVFNNFKFAGKVGEDWVEVEASMPLADAGIKSGDVIAVYSWSNKSGDDLKKTPIVYTVK